MKTIHAAVARGIGLPFSLEQLTLEDPRPDELVVRLVACGICHTDMAMRDHEIYPIPHPVVLGHEGAGVVERVGAAVSKVVPGDHVVLFADSCGRCPSCLDNAPTYCFDFFRYNFAGTRVDGTTPLSLDGKPIHIFQHQSAFATHTVCRERNAVKIPRSAPLEVMAPLGCGIVTGAGAIMNSLRVRAGSSVAVFGTGSVGLSAIIAASLVGAGRIIAIDVVETRLEMARSLGANHTINPTRQDVPRAIRQIAAAGVDYTLDTTGNMTVLRQAIDVLAPRGSCGFVGGAPKGASLTIDVEQVMTGGRTIRGIIEGDATPEIFIPKLVELYQLGRFPIDRLMAFYPFTDINKAVDDVLHHRVIKPVLRISSVNGGDAV